MTQPITTPQEAIERIAMLTADLLSGRFGNPQSADTDTDINRLKATQEAIADHLDVMTAQEIFRKQEWCGHIPEAVQDVDVTTSQIAADVARLEDMQKQDPAALHGSIDSLHASWQKLDLLLEPYAKTFTDMVRRSKSFTPQGRQ